MATNEAIRALRENYDKMTPSLRARIDAECERLASSATVGRKPFPASKLRSRKIQISLNESEFSRIFNALDDEPEIARGIRELALKAADEINASRGE